MMSLKLAVELLSNTSAKEKQFLYLKNLDENRRDASLDKKAHKKVASLSTISLFNLMALTKVTWF